MDFGIDLSFIGSFFKDIYDFVVFFIDYLSNGVFDVLSKVLTYWIQQFTVWSIEWSIFVLALSFDVGSNLLNDLNISTVLNSAYSNLDNNTIYFLSVLRFPEIVNNILSGLATGFAMSFIPR